MKQIPSPDVDVCEDPPAGLPALRPLPGRAVPAQLRHAQKLPGAAQGLLPSHRTQEART